MTTLDTLINEFQRASCGSPQLDQLAVDYIRPGKRAVGRKDQFTRCLDSGFPGEEIIRVERIARKSGDRWRAKLVNGWFAEGNTEVLARRLAFLTWKQFEHTRIQGRWRLPPDMPAKEVLHKDKSHRTAVPRLTREEVALIGRAEDDHLVIATLCEEIRRLKDVGKEPLLASLSPRNVDLFPSGSISARPATSGRSAMLLSDLLSIWQIERQPTMLNIVRVSRSVRRFIDVNGDRPLNDYTKDQVRLFLRELREVPKYLPRRLFNKPMQAILRYSRDNQGLTLITPASIRAYLKDIHLIFNWAITRELCSLNPASGLGVSDDRDRSQLRVAFDKHDLQLIFERAPQYAGCLRVNRRKIKGEMIIKDSLFWFPLVALFTGARMGEIAAATLDDFKKDGDVYYFEIQAPTPDRRLKSQSAHRLIPLHPELMRIGFLKYLECQKEKGNKRVFLEVQGQRNIQDPKGWSQYWRLFQESVGIVDRRKVFHSFRHTFKRACRDSGIEEEVHDVLTGHRPYESGRRYGQGVSLKTLAAAIDGLSYEGLNLAHLYEA